MEKGLDLVSVRLVKDKRLFGDLQIRGPEDAIKAMGEVLKNVDREVVCVFSLKSDGTPINCNIVSVGSLNASIAEPREILTATLLSRASALLLLHNHPSDDLTPSKEDIKTTDRLARICNMIGTPLLDHVIVGGDNTKYFSFLEKGIVNFRAQPKYTTDINDIKLGMVAENVKEEYQSKPSERGFKK